MSEREGGVRVGMMEREGRRCPFKRRRPSRDLFSFPGRKAEPGLGAQGGEVQGWAVGRRGTHRRESLPPALLAVEGLPFQILHLAEIQRANTAKGARPGPSRVPGCPESGTVTCPPDQRESRSTDLERGVEKRHPRADVKLVRTRARNCLGLRSQRRCGLGCPLAAPGAGEPFTTPSAEPSCVVGPPGSHSRPWAPDPAARPATPAGCSAPWP